MEDSDLERGRVIITALPFLFEICRVEDGRGDLR
jgi:hypothetical protein